MVDLSIACSSPLPPTPAHSVIADRPAIHRTELRRLGAHRDIPAGLLLLDPVSVHVFLILRDAFAKEFARVVVVGNFRLASRLVISESCPRVVSRRVVDHFEHSVMCIRGLVCVGLCWCPVFVLDRRTVWFYLTFVERAVHESERVGYGLAIRVTLKQPVGVRLPIFGCRLAAQASCGIGAFVDGLSCRYRSVS